MDTKSTLKGLVLQAEKQLLWAMKTADLALLDELLHDDLLFMLPGGETITKQQDLEVYRSGEFVINGIDSVIEQVSIIENNVVVTLTNEIRGTHQNNAFAGKYKYIRVWNYSKDQLKVIAGSGTQLPTGDQE
ncbi:hypothetical protein D3C87_95230 [compost metagenome]